MDSRLQHLRQRHGAVLPQHSLPAVNHSRYGNGTFGPPGGNHRFACEFLTCRQLAGPAAGVVYPDSAVPLMVRHPKGVAAQPGHMRVHHRQTGAYGYRRIKRIAALHQHSRSGGRGQMMRTYNHRFSARYSFKAHH
ncbi:hypothetical protein D3C76_1460160 [compost metagenome]